MPSRLRIWNVGLKPMKKLLERDSSGVGERQEAWQ
jgi:hypothetical protein